MQRKSYVPPIPDQVPLSPGIMRRCRDAYPASTPLVGSDRAADELGEVELLIASGNGRVMQYDSGHFCLHQVEVRLTAEKWR
jgi:hypothetical protein